MNLMGYELNVRRHWARTIKITSHIVYTCVLSNASTDTWRLLAALLKYRNNRPELYDHNVWMDPAAKILAIGQEEKLDVAGILEE